MKNEAKKSTTKAAKEKSAPARMFSRTVGRAIVLLLQQSGSGKSGLAQRLSDDEQLSRKELVQLRNGVNAVTAKLREGGDSKVAFALALAHINMGVQRLSRQAK
jgi:hypothetical protein